MKKKGKITYVKIHTNPNAVKSHKVKIRNRGGKVKVKNWGSGDVMLTYHFPKNKI